ncbi:hypothetical protein Prudu_189S000400 [Prunus dulcis]|uniref:Uncharacterized protein n=1 Tax=Prunus dulcis TaxID=3755 RepID=A0A5H2XHD2_PRUDU|nr:hypothetical protein Prudu_189S000400 [Prunus dulcis]
MTKRRRTDRASARQIGSPRSRPSKFICGRCYEIEIVVEFYSDIKGIMSALHQIQEKAHKDGLKKNEETISRKDKKESDDEKACTDKIAKLEESLKKKKQDDRTFSFLRRLLAHLRRTLSIYGGNFISQFCKPNLKLIALDIVHVRVVLRACGHYYLDRIFDLR